MQEEDKIEHVRSLPQVKEDPALQKIAWKMQNVCWVVIRIFMLLIAAGLFGNGPISNVRETKNNILWKSISSSPLAACKVFCSVEPG